MGVGLVEVEVKIKTERDGLGTYKMELRPSPT